MIARIPEFASDLSWLMAFAGGAVAALWRAVSALKLWMTSELVSKLDRIDERLKQVERMTHHHLGPNGDSTPLHGRIARLEANSIRRRDDFPNP